MLGRQQRPLAGALWTGGRAIVDVGPGTQGVDQEEGGWEVRSGNSG